MEKILNYFRNYFEKNSWLKISGDFVFYVMIVFILIPSTRTMLIRATLFPPKLVSENATIIMNHEEFQLILENLNGQTINLGDFKGKTIFVNFWATWCPPCRAEMPSLKKFCKLYGQKINVFLITTEERLKVLNYLKESGYDLPVYFQKSPAKGNLEVHSLPTSYLISEKSEILIYKKGAADWNSIAFRRKLDEILPNAKIN
jgi:thiol-disulfide isomerase/thioredoxin